MNENKIEKLLYEIGEDKVKTPPEDIVKRAKKYVEYRYLKYILPFVFVLNIGFMVFIILSILPKMSLKDILLWCNISFSLSNGIIAFTILCFNNLQEKFE